MSRNSKDSYTLSNSRCSNSNLYTQSPGSSQTFSYRFDSMFDTLLNEATSVNNEKQQQSTTSSDETQNKSSTTTTNSSLSDSNTSVNKCGLICFPKSPKPFSPNTNATTLNTNSSPNNVIAEFARESFQFVWPLSRTLESEYDLMLFLQKNYDNDNKLLNVNDRNDNISINSNANSKGLNAQNR